MGKELTKRHIDILRIIVEEFLSTGDVIGSITLLKKYDIGVSPATVRNDMAFLEDLELVFQPYNSAGRKPTAKGLRVFVDYMMQSRPDYFLSGNNKKTTDSSIKTLSDYIHSIIYDLSNSTKVIGFFVSPVNSILYYNGLSQFLKDNHKYLGDDIYNLVGVLEDKFNFLKLVEELPIGEGVNVFIGQENIVPALRDYTMIVKPLTINGEMSYVGVIGGLNMDYAFNISAVRGII